MATIHVGERKNEDFILFAKELKTIQGLTFLKVNLRLLNHSEVDWFFIINKIKLISTVDTIMPIYGYTEEWVDVPKGRNPIKLVPYLDYIEFESLKNPDELEQYLIDCFEDLKIIKQLC